MCTYNVLVASSTDCTCWEHSFTSLHNSSCRDGVDASLADGMGELQRKLMYICLIVPTSLRTGPSAGPRVPGAAVGGCWAAADVPPRHAAPRLPARCAYIVIKVPSPKAARCLLWLFSHKLVPPKSPVSVSKILTHLE